MKIECIGRGIHLNLSWKPAGVAGVFDLPDEEAKAALAKWPGCFVAVKEPEVAKPAKGKEAMTK